MCGICGFISKKSITLEQLKEMNNTNRYRFFILSITWPQSVTGVDNAKEADIVYIVTKSN